MTLPMISGLRETVIGDQMDSIITDAKRSAALLTCKKLHEIGELDNHLRPKKIEAVLEDKDYLFLVMEDKVDSVAACLAGTATNKRWHPLEVSFFELRNLHEFAINYCTSVRRATLRSTTTSRKATIFAHVENEAKLFSRRR